jgi:beta-glucosidase
MEEDLDPMSELGLGAYRFSISWARVLPDGTGEPNQRGLDYYRVLIDAVRRRGIVPAATIYHWELPQALEDQGGWADHRSALCRLRRAGRA